MATTHVFIVDINTFKYHLEYQFAGTGAAPPEGQPERFIDFNNSPNTVYYSQTENNLVGMIADSQRVRKNDYVVFYLQQNFQRKIYEGKFFGIFKVKNDYSFLDNADDKQFLKDKLEKSLTFRTLIEPLEVFPEGVTEWEALDEIKHIQSPFQMLWSLIYRKLKGNRGNTMITIYESERIFKLIRDKNKRQTIQGQGFTFDIATQKIKCIDNVNVYTGRQEQINIFPRLRDKYINSKAFESHLQAYIVQNIGRNSNPSLDACLLGQLKLEWLGNEVSCGVGMQRIDVLLDTLDQNSVKTIIPVELKAVEATSSNTIQIQRYVDWLTQYYITNRIGDIQPVLIALSSTNRLSRSYLETIAAFKEFNNNNQNCMPIKYIEYQIVNGSLLFQQIVY